MPHPRSPTPAVLYAIARLELQHALTISDGEWAERCKRQLVRQGYAYPWPHELTRAMATVEFQLQRAGVYRPSALAMLERQRDAAEAQCAIRGARPSAAEGQPERLRAESVGRVSASRRPLAPRGADR